MTTLPAIEEQPTLLIATHNNLLAFGLRQMLSEQYRIVEDEAPDVVLVDMAYDFGTDRLKAVRERWPSAKLVLLTHAACPLQILAELYHGFDIKACLSTTVSVAILTKTLELVVLGEAIAPAQALRPQSTQQPPLPSRPGSPPSRRSLSKQENAVLSHIVDGASNKLIARELGCQDSTVKVHVKSILRKLGFNNRTQAAVWAQGRCTQNEAGDEFLQPSGGKPGETPPPSILQ
jgi:two-component system nitrate/nitrite response regulator NarL